MITQECAGEGTKPRSVEFGKRRFSACTPFCAPSPHTLQPNEASLRLKGKGKNLSTLLQLNLQH